MRKLEAIANLIMFGLPIVMVFLVALGFALVRYWAGWPSQ